ncbi:hypothetical protein Scep_029273 [Stephania cephalantha]|uniref:Polygalacturonase n=1 Tax=Stephania cephalantha TaxID=152367 RepID=A0AAP0E1T7_9MAGN
MKISITKNIFSCSARSLFLLTATIIISTSSSALAASASFNVVALGAKGDGRTDSTRAFQRAWSSACASSGASSNIYVPPGRYLLNRILFRGQCKGHVTFKIDGTLVASSNYHVLASIGKWITFAGVRGVSIYGGTIDGQGTGLWACKAAGKNCPFGATSLEFTYSRGITISGLTSMNSQVFHIVIHNCMNVNLQGVQVTASGNSPNTDGIHVEASTGVTITRAAIKTGDDCISIGPGTTNLLMENIKCGPGHGISIGSLGKAMNEQGVQNVTVKTATFTGSQNGVRIKTWARSSNGYVKGVLFEDITMNNAQNPIIIDQNYCPHNEGCPGQVSGVKISDVVYMNIRGTSASQVAMKFDCSRKAPCSGIVLDNVDLTYKNKPALSSCTSADGSASGFVHPSSCLAA